MNSRISTFPNAHRSRTSGTPQRFTRLATLVWLASVPLATQSPDQVAAQVAAQSPSRTAVEEDSRRPVARVDEQTITVADLARELATLFPVNNDGEATAPQVMRKRREAVRDQLVQRALVTRYLREHGGLATNADVDLAKSRLRKQLEERQESWDEFLARGHFDEPSFERHLQWQLSWQRFLDRQRTDANLERYFQRHRADFDGTEVQVAHILFSSRAAEGADREELRRQASEVLAQIRAGGIRFAEAAKKHSSSPTRDMGGNLGWISRHDPMPESFSAVAFSLIPGQVSEPIDTPVGVHLIQCLEIRSGKKDWMEVRHELETAIRKYLFRWAADQVWPQAKITLLDF